MSKNLQDLAGENDISSIVENELNNCTDIKYKNQKKTFLNKLNSNFDGYLLDGYNRQTYGNFATRALTSYVISKMFDIPKEEAITYITDDVCDYGIDALYFYNNNIYLFQTKFSNNVKREDVCEIKNGINMIFSLDANIQNFNIHFKRHQTKIDEYLKKDDSKVVPILIFFGNAINNDVEKFFDNEITHNPNYGDYIEKNIFIRRDDIFEFEIEDRPISEKIILDTFFNRKEPYNMFCGCVKVNMLKDLYTKYNNRLFSKNIRYLIKDSSINVNMQNTLNIEPENFLYYNNGITLICDTITVLPHGATSPTLRYLKLENINIVNGAQTVISSSQTESIPDTAIIQLRIIETKGSNQSSRNDDISENITRFNNSQNAVSIKDLRTLDSIHKQIRKEFIKNGYYYLYKTGEIKINSEDFDFEDLMISLACYYKYSHTAKNSKGTLWNDNKLYETLLKVEDISLFLKLVYIKSKIDIEIEKIENELPYIIHWNRLILELFYELEPIKTITMEDLSKTNFNNKVNDISQGINSYITLCSKNKDLFHRQAKSYDEIRDYIIKNTIKSKDDNGQLQLFKN